MNKLDIQQYLVEPDFAKWLKEQGFDGECDYWFTGLRDTPSRMRRPCKNSQLRHRTSYTMVSTFQSAFDFCEDKFGITVNISWEPERKNLGDKEYWLLTVSYWDSKNYEWNAWSEGDFKTKREANIHGCEAIKEYVENLK